MAVTLEAVVVLENTALWYEAPLGELQEGRKEKKKKREVGGEGGVTKAANHSAREPQEGTRTAQHHMPNASCLQTSSPAMYVACTYRLSFSIRKSASES